MMRNRYKTLLIASATAVAGYLIGGGSLLFANAEEPTYKAKADALLSNKGIIAVDSDKENDGNEVYANFDSIDKAIKSNAEGLDTLRDSLDGISIRKNPDSGKLEWKDNGADTWSPFSNSQVNIQTKNGVMTWTGSTKNAHITKTQTDNIGPGKHLVGVYAWAIYIGVSDKDTSDLYDSYGSISGSYDETTGDVTVKGQGRAWSDKHVLKSIEWSYTIVYY